MVGFAVLIVADHRGLQSLGRVLTIGMSCCLFSSLVILPTLLVWLTNHRPLIVADEEEGPGPAANLEQPADPASQSQRKGPGRRVDSGGPADAAGLLRPRRVARTAKLAPERRSPPSE